MKCYECKWLDRSVILTSNPPQYGCTLGFGSHYADHECEYDFMPIVRCKDCRYWEYVQDDGDCIRHTDDTLGYAIGTKANDFCSYGERKKP